jgi:DNA adenine methylase
MKLVMLKNGLLDGHYVEIYAGGAGIAWMLLFEEYASHVHINDLSKPIYSFWHSVLFNTEELCRRIRDTRVTMTEWHRQKAVQASPGSHSLLDLGFSTFFLNRTNRSGIITGGVIGGKAQGGNWKLDVRFNKPDLIARIERIARYASRISLHNLDASEYISDVLPLLPDKALVYMDPPYYARGEDLYESSYCPADHAKISQLVKQTIRQPWIVSYDSSVDVARLYTGLRCLRYDLSYSAQARYSGSEVMFFSKRLLVPRILKPVSVRKADLVEAA